MKKQNLFLENASVLINSSKLNEILKKYNNISVSEIDIDKEKSKIIKKNIGKYITISFDNTTILFNSDELTKKVYESIQKISKYLKIEEDKKVLIVGLGNKNINADSLGYNVVSKIKSDSSSYYLVYKNVEEVTKINSYSFIKNLNKYLKPDVIIIIDSLKANNIERLNYTIQITSGGINPGSGSMNTNNEISDKTINTKVISIGVPLIIDTSSIINDTIDFLDINSKSLKKKINNEIKYSKYDMLVCTSDIDNIVDILSYVISDAIIKYIH